MLQECTFPFSFLVLVFHMQACCLVHQRTFSLHSPNGGLCVAGPHNTYTVSQCEYTCQVILESWEYLVIPDRHAQACSKCTPARRQAVLQLVLSW